MFVSFLPVNVSYLLNSLEQLKKQTVVPSVEWRAVKTLWTLLANNIRHCCAELVARVWTPCWEFKQQHPTAASNTDYSVQTHPICWTQQCCECLCGSLISVMMCRVQQPSWHGTLNVWPKFSHFQRIEWKLSGANGPTSIFFSNQLKPRLSCRSTFYKI